MTDKGVTGISDDWYRSTMGVIVIRLGTRWSAGENFGAPGSVSESMRKLQTISERCLGSYRYSVGRMQVSSRNLRMSTSDPFSSMLNIMHRLLLIVNAESY